MLRPLKKINDLYNLSEGDQFTAADRKALFTGTKVGNTYQKGINWIGNLPNLDLIILRSSPKEYGDRWLDHKKNRYLYYLMIEHRDTSYANINYNSKENRALLDYGLHNAKILLTTNDTKNKSILNVEGYFRVIETRRDNIKFNGIDSVVLERIDLESNKLNSQSEYMSNEEFLNWFKVLPKSEQFQIIFEHEDFDLFCEEIDEKYESRYDEGRIKTINSAGKARSAWISDIYRAVEKIYQNYELFKNEILNHHEYSSKNLDKYMEAPFRKGYEKVLLIEEFDEIYGWATEQTPSFTETLTKIISFTLNGASNPKIDKILDFSKELLENFLQYPETIGFDEWDLNGFDQVILQPSASRSAQKNFGTTVEVFTELDEISHFLTREEFEHLSKDGTFLGFWGVRNVPPSTWERISPGALVLFFANKTAFAACRLGNKIINQKLAEHFWEGKGTESFKYMYSIVEGTEIDIPQSFINKSLGYKENFVVQGFQVLNHEKSSLLLSDLRELQNGKTNIGNRGSGFKTCIGCDRTMIEEEINEQGFCPTC